MSRTIVKLPFSNASMHSHTGKVRSSGLGLASLHGRGIGGVLLRPAGGGGGSSYTDMDDYIHTTGIDPYKRTGMSKSGRGLSQLSSKLSSLKVNEPHSIRKNIVMNI